MLPGVNIQKADFATGSVAPQPTGQLAIIASSVTGTNNQAATYNRDTLVLEEFGYGPLTDYSSYCLQVGKKPVLPIRPTTSTAAAYGSVTSVPVTGTSSCTSAGLMAPLDEYDINIEIVQGGTVGQSGLTYEYSLDGDTYSGTQQLPATVPAVVNFNAPDGTTLAQLQFGAGTLSDGATYQCFTTRAMPGTTDLVAALEALRVSRQGWEGALIDCTYVANSTVGFIDEWLEGLEDVGQFHFVVINTRHKNEPVPTAETEAAYATAMQTLTQDDASIRMCVGTDAGDLTSTLTGISQPRPTALFLAARAMLIPVGEDPAFVGRGNLPGVTIADARGNPRWHDEDLYETLDQLRLVALRSFAPGGPQGVYICNANVISPANSDYVWLQHVRCMNLACSIAWQVLTSQLSIGLAKQAPDPTTGAVYILPKDAQRIDGMVNAAFAQPLKGQVTAVLFTLSQDDDLSSNSDSTITGSIALESLAYGKDFDITTSFVKTITVGS
jgi:hypothetical protein